LVRALRKPVPGHSKPALAAIPGEGELQAELLRLETHFSHLGHHGPTALNEALAKARAAGDAGLLARALCLMARADVFRGRAERGIATADEAIALIATLEPGRVQALAGVTSEAWRTAGRGYFKLGNLTEALPRLETAVTIAEEALDPPAGAVEPEGGILPLTAFPRALQDLGVAFTAVHETGEAIATYARAIAAADARPEIYRLIPDDILLSLTGWAEGLQQRHLNRRAALAARKSSGPASSGDLVAARAIISGRAATVIERAEQAAGEGATPLSGYGYQSYYGALGRQLLFEDEPEAAVVEFERQKALGTAVGNATAAASGEIGMATALYALERHQEALEHAHAALARLGEDDDAALRAEALLVASRIYASLGDDGQALDALEAYNAVRDLLQARDAKLYASYLASRVGLEKLRAEADAQRRIAADLAVLNARLEAQAAELSAQSSELIAARQNAEASHSAKSRFLANMSHELRTPLNAILGFSELMMNVGDSPYSGYAGDIHEAGTHLLNIINDVLDLSRIEAGGMDLDFDTIFVEELFAECHKLVADKAAIGGVKLVSSVAEDAQTVQGDASRLRQILLSLLSNAIKFTPRGGIVALAALISHENEFLFTVADTGCGMTADEIEIALEPFGMVDASMGRRKQGSGLGLPLARRLTLLHGGSLVIHSEPNLGTQVTVSLPRR
jgi:signal transduction histidine kinase